MYVGKTDLVPFSTRLAQNQSLCRFPCREHRTLHVGIKTKLKCSLSMSKCKMSLKKT